MFKMSASYTPLHQHDSDDLIHKEKTNPSAPLAKSELDEDIDEREVVTNPYPGIDDGFFDKGPESDHPENPDIEVTIPDISSRFGGADEADGVKPENGDAPAPAPAPTPIPAKPHFLTPGINFDFEAGSIPGDPEMSIPDVNVYQHKKTLAQGMMDLALFSANANQLRYVVETYQRHPYFYPSVIFIGLSLILQVGIGIGLIWNATYNVKDEKEICIANKINNFTIIGIFLVTVINVFISAFGVANPA